jgi:uncharacterized protein (UPF0335 family)
MLLNDIGKSPDTTFKKINQHLQTNYGFKISEDVSDKDLVQIMEKIEEEIADLKIKGDDAKSSPEISKRLLILEGIQSLREFAMFQIQSPDLDHVIKGLSDYVHDSFRLGGTTHEDFDECVRDGMKHYRSSKYRFPDDMIEQRIRDAAMLRLRGPAPDVAGEHSPINPVEESPLLGEEELDKGPFDDESKRAGAHGGHAATHPTTKVGQRTMQILHNPNLELANDEQPKMVRNPRTGRLEVDPFDAKRIALKKGIVMKENLVKNLRRLLETEVSQAEVMMAAKGFAQELQEMVEKIGRLQNEDLPPVTDQMRETYGTESSSAFQTQIYGALQGVMDALYTAKNQVDDAVSNMAATGQVSASVDMDKDLGMDAGMDDMDAGMDADLDNIAGDLDAEDEFGGADMEEPLGRAKKMESAQILKRKVLEMQRLVDKAKKLKEAQK